MNKFTRFGGALTIATAALIAAPSAASAHVSILENEQPAGASALLTFSNGHGCDGSPTTKIEIQIPESIVNVTPTRNANWELTVEEEELAEPIVDAHGVEITSRESVVVYTAINPLPDGQRDTFVLSLTIPEDAAGTQLAFPAVQTCEVGSTAWIEIPEPGQDPHELDAPAPTVTVTEAVAHDDHGHAVSEDDEGEEADADHGDGEEAAEDTAASDVTSVPSTDDGTDAVAIIALIVGGLGLVAGTTGLVLARRKA